MDTGGFFRNINEKHNIVTSCLDSYFTVVISDSPTDKKRKYLLNLGQAAETLASQMAAKDRPQWLRELISVVNAYTNKPHDNGQVSGVCLQLYRNQTNRQILYKN